MILAEEEEDMILEEEEEDMILVEEEEVSIPEEEDIIIIINTEEEGVKIKEEDTEDLIQIVLLAPSTNLVINMAIITIKISTVILSKGIRIFKTGTHIFQITIATSSKQGEIIAEEEEEEVREGSEAIKTNYFKG